MDWEAVLNEIIEYNNPAKLRPDEFTVRQYIERRKERGDVSVSYNTTLRYLNRLVDRGVLKVRRVLDGGCWKNAYSAAGEDD